MLLEEVLINLVKKISRPNPMFTPVSSSVVAKSSLEDLHPSHNFRFPSDKNSTSLLNQVQYKKCKNIKDEHELFQFLTRHLISIGKDCNRVFVNSEEFPWLEAQGDRSNLQKPDGFFVPVWAYEKKTLTVDRGQSSNRDWRFGGVPDRRLYEFTVIVDCKLGYNNSGYGEHIIHLQCLNMGCPSKTVKGIYVHKSGFVLSFVTNGVLSERIYGEWTDGGIVKYIQDKLFNPTKWDEVEIICNKLKVDIVDPHKFGARTCSFIGQGGMGKIIAVHSKKRKRVGTSDLLALKVVDMHDHELFLGCEFDMLK